MLFLLVTAVWWRKKRKKEGTTNCVFVYIFSFIKDTLCAIKKECFLIIIFSVLDVCSSFPCCHRIVSIGRRVASAKWNALSISVHRCEWLASPEIFFFIRNRTSPANVSTVLWISLWRRKSDITLKSRF